MGAGLYDLKPQNFGECIAMFDPPTQYARFYLVNSSDAYYLGGYYEYGTENRTLNEVLSTVERNVVPVLGNHSGDYVIFSFKNGTYKIPVKELMFYLWSDSLLDHLVAFPSGMGIVIVPAVEIDAIESNFTIMRKPGKQVDKTLIVFNVTYHVFIGYLIMINGTAIRWETQKVDRMNLTWDELSEMFNKPLYAFYFDGKTLKSYPLIKVKLSWIGNAFHLSPKYEFINLAPSYEHMTTQKEIKTKTLSPNLISETFSTSIHSTNLTSSPLTNHTVQNSKSEIPKLTSLLLILLVVISVSLFLKRR